MLRASLALVFGPIVDLCASRKIARQITVGRAGVLVLAVAGLLCFSPFRLPAASAATDPNPVFADINEQRAANGIPSLAMDQSLLRPECTLQNHHIASPSTTWSATETPWGSAPAHQSMLYDPLDAAAGYGEYPTFTSNDPTFIPGPAGAPWACMWFTWAQPTSGNPTFYSYTNEDGRSNVPLSETTNEWPETPAGLVGLPPNGVTGPNILVYALGMGRSPHIASASLLTSSGQAVDTRFADGTTPMHDGHPLLFPDAGDLIPVTPLAPWTAYAATINWVGSDGSNGTQHVTFTTSGMSNSISIEPEDHYDGTWAISFGSTAPNPSLTLTGPNGQSIIKPALESGTEALVTKPLHLAAGHWNACVSSGGTSTSYAAAQQCAPFEVAPHIFHVHLALGRPRHKGRKVLIVATYDTVLVTRRATLQLKIPTKHCRIVRNAKGSRYRRCQAVLLNSGRPRLVILRSGSTPMTLQISLHHRAVVISLHVSAFRVGGVTYGEVTAQRGYNT